jgi:mycoredoxin
VHHEEEIVDEWAHALHRGRVRLLRAADRAPGQGRGVTYEQVDVDGDPAVARWVEEVNGGPRTVPVVVYPDGSIVTNPEPREVLAALGH